MDNFTHALAGLLAAETLLAVTRRGSAQATRARGTLLFASALANNVPDFDFVYTRITPGTLGYLLHHRGHTHTFAAGLLLSLAVYWPFSRWLSHRARKGAAISSSDRRALLGLCLAGPVIHIGLDATNNYGVHPFWPLYSGWFYGDSVFIVEPWLWVVSLPALFASARTSIGRTVFVALGALGLFAAKRFSGMSWALLAALGVTGVLFHWLALRVSARPRLISSIAGWSLVTALFAGAALRAGNTLASALGAQSVVDVVTTPHAANPLCYSAIAVEVTRERYRATLATVSTLPALLAASDCPKDRIGTTAQLEAVQATSDRAVSWYGRYEASLSELSKLAARCDVAAALRFYRVPFWKEAPGGGLWVGDLRYDRVEELDFDEMELPAKPVCPPHVPPWIPPRSELKLHTGASAGAGAGR